MARIRTIKPEFWTSEQVVGCSTNARLLFVGLLNFCDDSGIHPASTKRLKMEVFPGDDFSDNEIRAMVDDLIAAGLLEEYEIADACFWRVLGFTRHQKIDQPTYRFPLPNGSIPEGPSRRRSENVRRTPNERSASVRTRKGMESKGMESKGDNGVGGESSTGSKARPRDAEEWVAYGLTHAKDKGKPTTRERLEESHDHYEANGWRQNSGKSIRDWKAACRGAVARHAKWSSQTAADDWPHVRDTIKGNYSADVGDTGAIERKLNPEQFRAAKVVGLMNIVSATEYDDRKLSAEFTAALSKGMS